MRAKVKKTYPYLLAFALPIIIFLLAFLILPNFNIPKSVLYQDPNYQYIDFLSYFKRLASGEESPLYSFNAGSGTGMIPLIAYYLINPFNILAFLVPDYELGYVFFIIILLNIGTAGLTSYYYFRKENIKLGVYKPLIFSIGYALSAFVLGYFQHFEWLGPIACLPIVCLGINKIIKEQKPWLYILSLITSILTCYYLGYMICIFSIIWFIYKIATRKDVTNVKIAVRQFIFSSILSGTTCAFLLVPTAFSMIGGNINRLTNNAFTFNSRFPLSQLPLQFTSNQSYYSPLLFSGTVTTLLAISFFCNKKISAKDKLVSLIMLFVFIASINISALCSIWHLGSIEYGAPYRFTFIIIFFTLNLAATSLESFRDVDKKANLRAYICFVIFYIFTLSKEISAWQNFLLYLEILIVIIMAIIPFKNKNQKKENGQPNCLIWLQITSILCFTITMLVTLGEWENGVTSFATTKEEVQETQEIVQQVRQQKNNDESFHRIEKTYLRSDNDGLQHGYQGLSIYSSTAKNTVKNTLMDNKFFSLNTLIDMANNGQISYGCLPPLSSISLSGVKYIIMPNWQKAQSSELFSPVSSTDKYTVYQYNLSLPIGFIISEESSKVSNKKSTILFNSLFESEVNDSETIFNRVKESDIRQTLKNSQKNNKSYTKQSEETDGIITYTVKNPTRKTLYYYHRLKLPNSAHIISTSEVLKKNNKTGEYEHLSHLSDSATLNLGDEEQIEIQIRFFKDKLELLEEEFYTENTDSVKKLVNTISNQPTNWKKISNTELEGNLDVKKDQQELILTLEYDDSWRATIDGEPIQIEKALGNLIGIKVNKGKHVVKIKYQPKGLQTGIGISLCSIIITTVWYITERRKNEKK